MNKNSELKEAVEVVLKSETELTNQFKRRFTRLIENAFKDEYRDDDIINVMELLEKEDNSNEN